MARLLRLPPEILLEIMTLVDDTPDVLEFGLTCRTMWKFAEEVLWRDRADNHVLWGLLPDDVFDYEWSMRDLTAKEWRPLLHYGRLIRHLHVDDATATIGGGPIRPTSYNGSFEDDDRPPPDPTPLEQVMRVMLSHSDASIPFFPQLRTLDLLIYSPASLTWIRPILRRPLQALEIIIESVVEFLTEDALCLIQSIQPCADMDKLILVFPSHIQASCVDSSLASLLMQLPNLRHLQLEMDVDSASIFPSLATRSSLETLLLDPRSTHFQPLPDVTRTTPALKSEVGFPSLRVFSCVFNQLSLSQAPLSLLKMISSPALKNVEMHCKDIDDLSNISKLTGDQWSASLISVSLHMDGLEREEYDAARFFDALSPLLQCSRLQTFKIRSERMALPLTDKHYESMASAWPELEEFVVDDRGLRREHALASCKALLYFASKCPRLSRLRICVNFDLPPDVMSLEPWDTTSDLRMLHLTYSTGSQANAITSFLSATFPHLVAFENHARDKGMAPVRIRLGLPGCSDTWQVYD